MTLKEWWKKKIRPFLPNDEIEWEELTQEEQQEIADLRENTQGGE